MTDQQPHTPTTDLMRQWHVLADHSGNKSTEEYEAEFDRWLATVEAAAEQRGAARGKVEGLREAADEAGSWGPACINAALAIRRSADLLEGVE